MKKLLFSVAVLATTFAFGQITLQYSFPDTEYVYAYTAGSEMFYVSQTQDNKLKIYNADYSLKKTINVPIPSGYTLLFDTEDFNGPSFAVSKHIFNTDDKYEFMIEAYYYTLGKNYTKLLLIDEDGTLIKDFHPSPTTKRYRENYVVYHDSSANINKLIVHNWINDYDDQADVYSLSTSELTTREIQSKGKLSAFPVPTNKILNIINPDNGANVVEIYDASGKMVAHKNFFKNENKISVDVENLPKGLYMYKVGDLSSKFIKN
ncbi:MAG: T9SS type A sorting domain-containing protein [Bergeyella sp.]